MTVERVVAAVLLVLSLLPLALAVGRVRPRLRRAVVLLPIASVAAIAAAAYLHPPHWVDERRVSDRPTEIQSEGYVTSRTCQACHPSQHASWRGSYHRTMTQVASPESIAATPESRLFEYGHHYSITRRGEQMWVGSDDPAWMAGDAWPDDVRTRPYIERPVVVVTGSHHEQVYWFPMGDHKLGMFPLIYRIREKRWIPYSGAFLVPKQSPPPVVAGRWNLTCIYCHTTDARPGVWNRTRMDSQVSEWGIACEACHGPGGDHVRANRDPRRRYLLHFGEEPDPTIVNPDRLSARLSTQVCGSCHSVHGFHSLQDAKAVARTGVRYRPGDDVESTRHIVRALEDPRPAATQMLLEEDPHFLEDRFWPDGRVSVTGREYNAVTSSPCYAGQRFSCLSCHQLHKRPEDDRSLSDWADDQLAPGMDGDQACLQCHASLAAELVAHTHHPADSAGSQCYNCHMPNTDYGLLKVSRSHQVSSPTSRETLEAGRPNACNLCHLDRPLAWTAEHLEAWYGIPAPEFADSERERTADAVLTLLRGDAGQRAVIAWHMGWAPAREASGDDWFAPFLAQLFEDPYTAVRNIAYQTLTTLPGYEGVDYVVFAGGHERSIAKWKVWEIWERRRIRGSRANASEILLGPTGGIQTARFDRLLEQRDDRRVFRAE